MSIRYTFGGDEFIYAEISQDMRLESFFLGISITSKLKSMNIEGVTEICPANASYMVGFNPDIIAPNDLLEKLKGIESNIDVGNMELDTRIIDMPVFYQDPYTHDCIMRFRQNHQDPSVTDPEYVARINGYDNPEQLIKAHSDSPWFVSMVGFVAGLPWFYQLVERDKQIEAPKYLKARIDTPKLTIGHGGCFGCLYTVRGGGGYQMLGVTPIIGFDPNPKLSYFDGASGVKMVFFMPGDIVKFRPISKEEHDDITRQIEDGTYSLKIKKATFSLANWQKDPTSYNKKLIEVFNG